MSKKVIFDVKSETVANITEQVLNKHNDSILVVAPFSGNISIHAPSKSGKHKGYHRLKAEVWIPEDAIKGDAALSDFGAFVVIRLPKARVQDHLIDSD